MSLNLLSDSHAAQAECPMASNGKLKIGLTKLDKFLNNKEDDHDLK
jgi:hypothetical protein